MRLDKAKNDRMNKVEIGKGLNGTVIKVIVENYFKTEVQMAWEAANMKYHWIDCSWNQVHEYKHIIGICSVCGDEIYQESSWE